MNRNDPVSKPRRRRGAFLTEMIVAMVLLVTLMCVLVPSLGWTLKQMRHNRERQIAQLELMNQLERLSTVPWGELTSAKVGSLSVPEMVSRELKEARIQGSLIEVETKPESRVITLQFDWRDSHGERVRPVELSMVIHHREGL